jgi:hypothetical protein
VLGVEPPDVDRFRLSVHERVTEPSGKYVTRDKLAAFPFV